VNVSVNKPGEPAGTRCEIKNLNSVKNMQVAISEWTLPTYGRVESLAERTVASEVFRHIKLLTSGQEVKQETRGFDEDRAETYSLRSKEDAPDYRYMPDPNIPPLLLTEVNLLSLWRYSPGAEISVGLYREDTFFHARTA